MKQPEQVRIIKEILRQLDKGVDADAGCVVENPASAYTSTEQAQLEWQNFFRNYPQLVGLSADLPERGSFKTFREFGVPILATRDENGQFRAFINACRHRGAGLTEQQTGCSKRFVCPFHGWTYANDGRLIGVTEPQNFGDIDKSKLGLRELPAEEKYGLLWVHPQLDGSLDVDELLGDLAEEIDGWHLGDRIFCGENSLSKPMNWKLANDTFGENYHFKRLHKKTLDNLFIGDSHAYESYGRNHRFVFATRGIERLRDKPETDWRIDRATTVLYYLFPNVQLTASERQITLFRIYPQGSDPSHSQIEVTHYFSQQALDQISSGSKTIIDSTNVYDTSARDGNAIVSLDASMEIINSTLENEDFRMAEATQKSVESGAIDYLLFGRNEPALHHFHNTFRQALGQEPLKQHQQ